MHIPGPLRISVFAIGLSTIFCGLVYATVQQTLRQSANDPQIQMAQDSAHALDGGASLSSLVPSNKIDISESVAPFLIIYDKNLKPLEGNGYFMDTLPVPPQGVFTSTKDDPDFLQDRVTWQPAPHTRIAAVTQRTENFYVLAGRNLREVELRENKIFMLAAAAWCATILFTVIYSFLCFKKA